MPLLKFKCAPCGKVFEELVKSAEIDLVCCECGKKAERVYEGKCLFGIPGSAAGAGAKCTGNCGGCSGCSA